MSGLIAHLSVVPSAGAAPFSPLDIAGCKMWLNAANLGLSDGNLVASWTDDSGNSNTATGSGSNSPIYKTGIVNGKPVVRFNGTTNLMTTPYTQPSTHTIFVVYKRTAFSPIGGGNGSGSGPLWRSTQLWPDVSSGNATTSTTIYTGAFVYLAVTCSGGPINGIWLNASNVLSSSSGAASTIALQLGASFDGLYSGDIAEVIIYDTALGTTNRQAVEAYLAAKYAI